MEKTLLDAEDVRLSVGSGDGGIGRSYRRSQLFFNLLPGDGEANSNTRTPPLSDDMSRVLVMVAMLITNRERGT